ncbi:MAG: helix-turn-helix transcriptional regulator [Saprospiraceae bacterium]|nr:helix-turn-helix transcriptional regulator [Saprospiraceae bacterium]
MIYLFFISTCFSVLFFLLLMAKKDKRTDHFFLALIFLFISINSLYISFFYTSEELFYTPLFSEFNYAIPLLYGPLLWFYAKSITNKDYKLRLRQSWHFLPFVVFLFILVLPLWTDYTLLDSKHLGYPLIKLVITPAYLISVLMILRNYRLKLKTLLSYEYRMNHMWLSWVTAGAIILWAIASAGFVYNEMNEVHKTLLYDFYVLSFLGVFLFALAFVAFNKTDIMYNLNFEKLPEDLTEENNESDRTSPEEYGNNKQYEAIIVQLNDFIKKEKPYLDPLLSISSLAEKSGIPQYKISVVLNKVLKQRFYDYINSYRVELVKERLKKGDTEKFSILGIALDSGFNSKASFNRVFKKKTGMTPSQYLKSLLGDSN